MATWSERWQALRNPPAVSHDEGVKIRRAGIPIRALAGARARPRVTGKRGRFTQDDAYGSAYGALWGVAIRPDREVDWRALNLDDQTLSRIGTDDLVQIMADLSPEVSSALWHFIRFCNPGWEAKVLRPGTETADSVGQARLDAFLKTLGELHGAVDVIWNSLFTAAFLRGAFLAELIADESGRNPVDLVVVDPHVVEFEKRNDPVRGSVWQLGQQQNGTFMVLDMPTVRYVPVDPVPGAPPYGRSLVTPAIFSALFLLSLLHDLRRVVAQQGYPRLDLEVKLEELRQSMPEDAEDDPDVQRQWVEGVIDGVAEMYAQLQPDDAYVHTDVVKVNRPVGAVDASSLGAVDSLIKAIERMATRGLKTMPLLMGSNEAVSETHANRQWEIHVAGIKALQHLAEQMIEHLLTMALQMQGVRSVVQFRFAELRASEELRDAQTESMRIDNAMQKYLAGWISQEEAALEVTGHATDRPAPRYIDNVGGPDYFDIDHEPADGVERVGSTVWQRRLFAEMQAAREDLERLIE